MIRCIRSTFFLAVVALATALGLPAQANLLLNGGFELPNVGGPGSGDYFLTINPGFEASLGFTGWTVVTSNIDVVDIPDLQAEFPSNLTAFEGDQVLDLHGTQGGVLRQDFETVSGQFYELFFAYNSNPYNPPTLDTATVSLSDVSTGSDLVIPFVISHTDNAAWLTSQVSFTATGSMTRLTFASLIPGQSSLGGIVLDDVRVGVVPAPGALVTALVGAVPGLTWLLRRRRQS